MTTTNNDVDFMSAPKDYDAFFRQYYPKMVALCGQLGIDENNKEDAAMEMVYHFMRSESLEKFNPDLVFLYRGEARPARFRSYLSKNVDYRSRGIRDRQNKLARREIQILDATGNGKSTHCTTGGENSPDFTGDSVANNASWHNAYGERQPDHADEVLNNMEEQEISNGIRTMLATIPRRNAHDTCDLVALYDAVRIQGVTFGEANLDVLKDHFGCSRTAMANWMWLLRAHIAHYLGKPLPPKRPRRLRNRTTEA